MSLRDIWARLAPGEWVIARRDLPPEFQARIIEDPYDDDNPFEGIGDL